MIVVEQRDFKIRTVDGASIAVRETRSNCDEFRTPVVLLHGVRPAGIDDAVDNDIFAHGLARAGHICFSVDVRGFEKSDSPPAGMGCARRPAPLVRSIEIARDMDAAANELRKVSGLSKVGIVQWGAPVGIVYAALWPEKVSHLVLCDMDAGAGGDAAAIQPGLPGDGDLGGIVETADVWPAGDAEAMSDVQTARPVRRLALQDLAPLRDSFPDELAMNYANHIYCRVMVIEPGTRPDDDAEAAAPFRREFIRAQEVCVRRPDATESGADGRNRRRTRGGLIGSLAEFLR